MNNFMEAWNYSFGMLMFLLGAIMPWLILLLAIFLGIAVFAFIDIKLSGKES